MKLENCSIWYTYEILNTFRERCEFVIYMPDNPANYGLKMYSMCYAKTFYTYNFEMYCGVQPPGLFYNLK